MTQLDTWIGLAKDNGASDLHLEPGSPLVMRVRGELVANEATVSGETLLSLAREILGGERWQAFLSERSSDLSQTIAGVRCRLHFYQTMKGVSIAVRLLSTFRNTLKDCNVHSDFAQFLNKDTGLVLVSGPTGSGKSTTLAAFVEEINHLHRRQIVTVESPIEYFFKSRKSFIRQREVGHHTPSFEKAIIDSMREDPDVLVIGEMRTPDVMRLTLNAAETGHLVFSTVHSSSCAEALIRLCMSFPSDLQSSICNQVADCLVGVICQQLIYLPKFKIRVPVCEILVANTSVKSVIRSGQFSKIPTWLQTGAADGMWTFERYRRWVDERQDWTVNHSQAPVSEKEDKTTASISIGKPVSPKPPTAPARTMGAPCEPSNKGSDAATIEKDNLNRIEINPSGEDLGELVKEMAKKLPNE